MNKTTNTNSIQTSIPDYVNITSYNIQSQHKNIVSFSCLFLHTSFKRTMTKATKLQKKTSNTFDGPKEEKQNVTIECLAQSYSLRCHHPPHQTFVATEATLNPNHVFANVDADHPNPLTIASSHSMHCHLHTQCLCN